MPRLRLSDVEYDAVREIIEDYRAARMKKSQIKGGIIRGAEIKNAHAFAAENPQLMSTKVAKAKAALNSVHEREAEALKKLRTAEAPPTEYGAVPFDDAIAGELRDDEVCEIRPGKIGIISDAHWPFHDLRKDSAGNFYGAYWTAIETLRDEGIDTLVLNGDMLDVYNLSDHEKVEGKRSWKWELDVAIAMLKHLRAFFGDKVRIVYREGNHEERYQRYLARKAKELIGTVHLEEFLKLRELGIEWVPKRGKMQAGQLWIDHGHEWFGGGGVTPGRNYRMKALDNILVGHVHRTSTDMIRRPLDGSFIAGWSVGCLCDLNPFYAARNGWNHGFALVDLQDSGRFTVYNKMIIDGEVR